MEPRFMARSPPPPMPRLALTRAEIAELADKLLAEQGGKCAIRGCDRTPKTRRFHIDHDHATGAIRGLVCHVHNQNMPRDLADAYAIVAYLEAHEGRVPPTKAEKARAFLVNEWRPVTKRVTR